MFGAAQDFLTPAPCAARRTSSGLDVETGESGLGPEPELSRLVLGLLPPLPVLPWGGEYRRTGLL